MSQDIQSLTDRLIAFRDERDWRQFHSLKNLILSLNLEAAELMELTQWKDDSDVESALSDDEFRASLGGLNVGVILPLGQFHEKDDSDVESALSDDEFRASLSEECADVLLYLLLICERADIDLLQAASNKIETNATKYPVEKSRGNARKYTEL